MQKPLVSILTPFKNTAQYLGDCLDSIVSQTYKDWELIIVDDHSKDDSYDVVFAFAERKNKWI